MPERELERLYAGLLKLAGLPDEELRVLLTSVLAGGGTPRSVAASVASTGLPLAPWRGV
jgi:hypothetical protein